MPERTTQILDLATRDFYAVPLAGTDPALAAAPLTLAVTDNLTLQLV